MNRFLKQLTKQYSPTYSVPPIIRSCQFVDGPFSPLIPYISSNEGSGDGTEWQKIQWNGKKAYASSTIGAKISFKFEGNNVGIYHYSTNGKGNEVQPGRAKCWIDEEEARGNITSSRKQRLINTGEVEADCYTPSGTNTLSYTRIRQGLTEGAQYVCYYHSFLAMWDCGFIFLSLSLSKQYHHVSDISKDINRRARV